MIYATVRLTQSEYDNGKNIALCITKANRSRNNPDRIRGGGNVTTHNADIYGLLGEIAYCKLFGLEPNLEIIKPGEHPAEWDVIHCGAKIDVKTTARPDGGLIVTRAKAHKDIDGFALMIQREDNITFDLAGWAPKDFVLEHTHTPPFIRSNDFYVYQHELFGPADHVKKDMLANQQSLLSA